MATPQAVAVFEAEPNCKQGADWHTTSTGGPMIWRVLVLMLAISTPLIAADPLSVAEAQSRLAQRTAEHHPPPTTRPSQSAKPSIAELEERIRELQQENEELRAELKQLKEPKTFHKIELGMTRPEL